MGEIQDELLEAESDLAEVLEETMDVLEQTRVRDAGLGYTTTWTVVRAAQPCKLSGVPRFSAAERIVGARMTESNAYIVSFLRAAAVTSEHRLRLSDGRLLEVLAVPRPTFQGLPAAVCIEVA